MWFLPVRRTAWKSRHLFDACYWGASVTKDWKNANEIESKKSVENGRIRFLSDFCFLNIFILCDKSVTNNRCELWNQVPSLSLSLSLSLSHFLLFRSNRFFVKRNFSIEKARRTGQYIRTILTQFFVGCWKYPYNTNTSTGLSITTVKLLVVIYSPWLHNKTVLNVMMSNTGS